MSVLESGMSQSMKALLTEHLLNVEYLIDSSQSKLAMATAGVERESSEVQRLRALADEIRAALNRDQETAV